MGTDFDELKKSSDLSGKRIAVVATHGFEQSELDVPVEAVARCSATLGIVAPRKGTAGGCKDLDWSEDRGATRQLDEVSEVEYDGKIRTSGEAVELKREFRRQAKSAGSVAIGAGWWWRRESLRGVKLPITLGIFRAGSGKTCEEMAECRTSRSWFSPSYGELRQKAL